MFGLFKKKTPASDFDPEEQALIVEGIFESTDEFGNEQERDALSRLESNLEAVLQQGGELDGHDVGDSGFVVYMYGKDVDSMFAIVEDTLKRSDFTHLEIIKRYGPAQDGVKEKRFTL